MTNTKFNSDLGLRHKPNMTSNEFIRRYCEVFRPYCYATQDDSLNEFEKLITHVLDMLQYHKHRAKLLGLPADPRDSINAIEDAVAGVEKAKHKLAAALYVARGDLPDYSVCLSESLGEVAPTLAARDAEIARLRESLAEIREIYTGSEGIPQPETAAEAYVLRLVEQMYEVAVKALKDSDTAGGG